MNILHLLSQNQLTGAEVYAVTLAEKQKDDGHNVHQISNDFFVPTAAQKLKLEVETPSKLRFWRSVLTLRTYVKANSIHVVHGHSRAAAKLASWALIGLRVGYVSTLHGRQHPSISKKLCNRYGQFLIAVCERIENQLLNEFRYKANQVKTVPNAVDPTLFAFRSRPLSGTPLKIAVIGRMSGPKKHRTESFIQGLRQILSQKNIAASFAVVGGASDLPGVSSAIHPKMDGSILHGYDLICASGRAAVEACMTGVPCIAFGESEYGGLATPDNFDRLTMSNFGDVGLDFNLPIFDPDKASQDLENFLSGGVDLARLSQMTQRFYSLERISVQVQRIYESAYFLKNYPYWIPILMYHKIPDQDLNSQHKIFVNKKKFQAHLRFFKKNGMTSLTFEELAEFRKARRSWKDFPKKPFVLTFDDGYTDNLVNASPLLEKYNFRAHVYLLADVGIKTNRWDAESSPGESRALIHGPERQRWLNSAFSIGSHGLRHHRLTTMDEDERWIELTRSKQLLEAEFNRPVTTYAYTYGSTDQACARAAQEAGYEYALNTDTGAQRLEDDPFSVFRVNIFPHETGFSLWKKTRKWYRAYYARKRKQ